MLGQRLRALAGAGSGKGRRFARELAAFAAAIAVLAGGQRAAHAIGERITDVRVLGNQRTGEDTIRSIAGVVIGDTLESDTLATVRERLNNVGLFADVNVWWEAHGEGVRVNIAVKDKFPWAPVPTASWSVNNKSIGLVFVHGNLFGRGKQFVVGARLATLDRGAVLAYRDPALLGTWAYWEFKGLAQKVLLPEYDSADQSPSNPYRQTTLQSFGIEPAFGIAWFRRVKTQVSWRFDKVSYKGVELFDPISGMQLQPTTNDSSFATTHGGYMGIGRAALAFDWRAREFAVMTGAALGGNLDLGSSTFGGDFEFWRATAYWEQGIRFFRRHNLVYAGGGTIGHDTPIWWDTNAGGSSLRGFLVQQFRGDTQVWGKIEYHVPLFSIGSLDVRGLGFFDAAAIWFRSLPPRGADDVNVHIGENLHPYLYRPSDGRTFDLNYVHQGFDANRDVHTDVGAGIRFFLRSVAIPLVGVDFGYGLEGRVVRYLIVIGA